MKSLFLLATLTNLSVKSTAVFFEDPYQNMINSEQENLVQNDNQKTGNDNDIDSYIKNKQWMNDDMNFDFASRFSKRWGYAGF